VDRQQAGKEMRAEEMARFDPLFQGAGAGVRQLRVETPHQLLLRDQVVMGQPTLLIGVH
jgi:hypothetical protein